MRLGTEDRSVSSNSFGVVGNLLVEHDLSDLVVIDTVPRDRFTSITSLRSYPIAGRTNEGLRNSPGFVEIILIVGDDVDCREPVVFVFLGREAEEVVASAGYREVQRLPPGAVYHAGDDRLALGARVGVVSHHDLDAGVLLRGPLPQVDLSDLVVERGLDACNTIHEVAMGRAGFGIVDTIEDLEATEKTGRISASGDTGWATITGLIIHKFEVATKVRCHNLEVSKAEGKTDLITTQG